MEYEDKDSTGDGDAWEDAASVASEAPSWVNETGAPERDFRLKTVYDAVAGRVRVHEARAPKWAGAAMRELDSILPPEEALYRSSGAPERYEETDTYFAHEGLRAGALPDSDLVKAVHHYASQYYEVLALREKRRREREREGEGEGEEEGKGEDAFDMHGFVYSRQRLLDERSMDETALLAFGILLEEAGRQALGEDGDLVFTEGAETRDAEGEAETRDAEAGEDEAKRQVTGRDSGSS